MSGTMPELDEPELLANSGNNAASYAWSWFRYHAGQRQAVFRFYLLVSGVILTAYFTVGEGNHRIGEGNSDRINGNAMPW